MTKKHYIALAAAIASSPFKPLDRELIARLLCPVFKRDNSKFDTEKFIAACRGD